MLIKKIKNKNLKIGIIGLGYVGLPEQCNFVQKNLQFMALTLTAIR